MKTTAKKGAPKASQKMTVKDLTVKSAKGRTLRGGFGDVRGEETIKDHSRE